MKNNGYFQDLRNKINTIHLYYFIKTNYKLLCRQKNILSVSGSPRTHPGVVVAIKMPNGTDARFSTWLQGSPQPPATPACTYSTLCVVTTTLVVLVQVDSGILLARVRDAKWPPRDGEKQKPEDRHSRARPKWTVQLITSE